MKIYIILYFIVVVQCVLFIYVIILYFMYSLWPILAVMLTAMFDYGDQIAKLDNLDNP